MDVAIAWTTARWNATSDNTRRAIRLAVVGVLITALLWVTVEAVVRRASAIELPEADFLNGVTAADLTQEYLADHEGDYLSEYTGYFSQQGQTSTVGVCWYQPAEFWSTSTQPRQVISQVASGVYLLRDTPQFGGATVTVIISPGTQAADFDHQWQASYEIEPVVFIGRVRQTVDGEWILYVHNAWLASQQPPAVG